MTNVGVSHDQVTVTYEGFIAASDGAPVNGNALANNIVIANHQSGGLTFVFQVRGIFTNTGKLEDVIVLTNGGGAFDDYVGFHHGTGAQTDVGADDRPGPYLNALAQLCRWINNCAWIYQAHRFNPDLDCLLNFAVGAHDNACTGGFSIHRGHAIEFPDAALHGYHFGL